MPTGVDPITSEAQDQASAAKSVINLPNQLTIARVCMVPVFVLLMSVDHWVSYLCAHILFIIATITDYYDGKIARARNLVTNFGKLLDPVADKVLVSAAFVMLMTVDELWIPGWTIVVILAREFLVTGVRSLAASDGVVIPANRHGKVKAALQMTYIYVFLPLVIAEPWVRSAYPAYGDSYVEACWWMSMIAITAVALYTVYTGVHFMVLNWRDLKLDNLS